MDSRKLKAPKMTQSVVHPQILSSKSEEMRNAGRTSQPLSIVIVSRSLECSEGEVGGEGPAEEVGEEAGEDVEEDEGGEDGNDGEDGVGFGDLRLLFELVELGVLGQLRAFVRGVGAVGVSVGALGRETE